MKEKLGSCIQKARPYYDALEIAKEAQLECQKAAIQFQRANGKDHSCLFLLFTIPSKLLMLSCVSMNAKSKAS